MSDTNDRNLLLRNGELVRDLMSIIGKAEMADSIPGMVEVILNNGSWRRRLILTSGQIAEFDSFEQFVTTPPLEGLGMEYDRLYRYCKGTPAQKMMEEVSKPVKDNGTNRYTTDNSRVDISTLENDDPKGGTSRNYTIRRLKRDKPELAQRVIDGEMTANEAAVIAGIRPPKVTIRLDDMTSIANTLRKKLSREQISELIDILNEVVT